MLSVVIITKNEQDRIKACLESVKWADEIIIYDNGSTDKTLEIAKQYTKKIFIYEGQDFAKLRNKAMDKISGDWILYIDSDERVLKSLKLEIEKLMISQTNVGAWAIPRRNIILGQEKHYRAFWPDYVIRLFKRSFLKGWKGKVHEQPEYIGDLGNIKEPFLHLTHRDIDSMVIKSLDWANIDAKLRMESSHPRMNGVRFLRILVTEIWNQGIIRRGFLNGTVGVIDSLLQAFSLYISYVKLWQLQQKKPLREVYEDIDKELMHNEFEFK